MCGVVQVGAPRPVAWFHFFDRLEVQEWRACREAAGYGGTKILSQVTPVTSSLLLLFMEFPQHKLICIYCSKGIACAHSAGGCIIGLGMLRTGRAHATQPCMEWHKFLQVVLEHTRLEDLQNLLHLRSPALPLCRTYGPRSARGRPSLRRREAILWQQWRAQRPHQPQP